MPGRLLAVAGGQAGASYEIIVVDDHSTDGRAEIAASFPVQVIAADPLAGGLERQMQRRLERREERRKGSGCCSPTPIPSTRRTRSPRGLQEATEHATRRCCPIRPSRKFTASPSAR